VSISTNGLGQISGCIMAIVLLVTGKKGLSESLNSDRERVCPVDSSWSESIVYVCMLYALCNIGAFREWGAPVLCLLVENQPWRQMKQPWLMMVLADAAPNRLLFVVKFTRLA